MNWVVFQYPNINSFQEDLKYFVGESGKMIVLSFFLKVWGVLKWLFIPRYISKR